MRLTLWIRRPWHIISENDTHLYLQILSSNCPSQGEQQSIKQIPSHFSFWSEVDASSEKSKVTSGRDRLTDFLLLLNHGSCQITRSDLTKRFFFAYSSDVNFARRLSTMSLTPSLRLTVPSSCSSPPRSRARSKRLRNSPRCSRSTQTSWSRSPTSLVL